MEIEDYEKMIEETFKNCCKVILEQDLKENEFDFCKRSIINFLEYFSEKRRTKGYL